MEEVESEPGHARKAIGIVIVLASSAGATARLAGVGLHFVPRWLALIVVVFGVLELLSVTWNIILRNPWNEKTLFDYVSDALMYLQWPW